jgi:Protein tyrosine and serine/threonine kinase
MSPEVARCEPYNLTADVYSFGLLLWQVCSLMLPYDGMNRQDHAELVVHGNERPPLDSSWSTPLRILMKRAWEPDPSVRPSMDSIYKILRREICALRDGDDTGLEHFSRRSTFVLNRESAANTTDLDKQITRGMPQRGSAMSRRNLFGQASQRALLRQGSNRSNGIRQGSVRRQGSAMLTNYSQRGDVSASRHAQFEKCGSVSRMPPYVVDRSKPPETTAMAV